MVKKKVKKICLATILLLFAHNVWAYDFESGGLYYNITSDTTVAVTYKDNNYNSYSGNITIPATVLYNNTTYSVTSIGDDAFSSCTGLTSVTIGNSVTSIGYGTFYGCTGLTSIILPNIVTSIGNYAFYLLPNLIYYGPAYNDGSNWGALCLNGYEEDSLIYTSSAKDTLCGAHKAITNANIPNSVTRIGNYAFYCYRALTSITMGNSVTSIGNRVFYNCSGLTSIILPNIVTSIGDEAFYLLPNLIYYGPTYNNGYNWGALCLNGYEEDSLIYTSSAKDTLCGAHKAITNANIPNSVTRIGNYAFYCYRALTSITMGNSVTSIGNRVFYNCIGLTSVTMGNSVTRIGNYAFYNCIGLTSVTIGNSVTSIGNYAFEGCTGLISITIPNSVTSIENAAFYGCIGLTSVTFLGSNTLLQRANVFSAVPDSIPIYIPCGSSSWYSNQAGLSSFSNIIEQFSYKYIVYSQDTTMGNVASTTTPTCIYYTWTISATANYGYHFTQWSDGNTQNPRTIQVLSDTILIAYFAKETTGIEDVSDVNNAVHLYPNPAKTMLTIENATKDVQIFDIAGRVVMNIDNKETNMLQINISHLSKGMYFVKVGNYTTKFVKE